MKKIVLSVALYVATIAYSSITFAQTTPSYANWYNGGGAGMKTEKAYKKLKNKKSSTVIVAVIDSGIDIEHEDLKGKIWVNEKEIPGNNIDDDQNGYVDDVHGWNFLGNSKGQNVDQANLEKTRLLREYSKKFATVDPANLSASEKEEYKIYEKVKAEVEADLTNYKQYLKKVEDLEAKLAKVPDYVSKKLNKKDYTIKDLKAWETTTQEDGQFKNLAILQLSGALSEEVIKEQKNYLTDQINYYLNVNFNERELIGDNPNDFSDTKYGNTDVEGPDALHGTHVGGIIGAIRGNNLGGDGVADNVKLMVLRAVPNGDENDKDIALAIRYAVDNGAKVINMSFGKGYSPHQKEVFEAFQYADSKGVLLIHAAGNDNANLETDPNFPTSMYSFQTKKLDLFLTIGASTRYPKKRLAAEFSNYGQSQVDVFAPGHDIYNSVPQSAYKNLQGTSMAAPMVAGAAALLKSYFPEMTMNEVKAVLLSTAKSYKGKKEYKPGTEELVDFGTLSVTGAVIDLEAAVKKCLELEKAKAN